MLRFRNCSLFLEMAEGSSCLSRNQKPIIVCIVILLIITILLTCILVPLHFSYVDYDELAFQKDTLNNDVDESQVYDGGRYGWGITKRPLKFPGVFQRIAYRGNDLLVFADNGLEFRIEGDLWYHLNETNLSDIYGDMQRNYEPQFRDAAKSAIKNTATQFSAEDFFQNRELVSKTMLININTALRPLHMQIYSYKFILLQVGFPDITRNKFLQTAVQELENDRAILDRDVQLIETETQRQVALVEANITITVQRASAQAEVIIKSAEFQAFKINQNAIGEGLGILLNELNVTDSNSQQELFNLLGIRDNPTHVKLISGANMGSNLIINTQNQ